MSNIIISLALSSTVVFVPFLGQLHSLSFGICEACRKEPKHWTEWLTEAMLI
jgi:hypothetical protein